MIVIGSRAMQHWNILPEDRMVNDWDFICTFSEFKAWTRKNKSIIQSCTSLSDSSFHICTKDGMNYEFEIACGAGSAKDLLALTDDEYIKPSWQLALKLSHRHLKNSSHFLKTMRDIQHLRSIGIALDAAQTEWLKKRELETYNYKHPRLDTDKQAFFADDGIRYVYDHDSIHEAVAVLSKPAYTFYMKDGSEVMTSKEKFFNVSEDVRLLGVYEETCVLALERSQIPYQFKPSTRKSFEKALMKVCTSITSGWFREYAWENYDEVLGMYERLGESDYVLKFEASRELLRPFK